MNFNELIGSPEFWEGAAFLVFIGVLIWLGAHKHAGRMIDGHAQKIRDQLAEAERLRKEAERLLTSIKQEREAAEKQAVQMIADAEEQAKLIRSEAQKSLAETVKRRAEMAERKIAQAQAQAEAEVKAAAADLAAEMAETVLTARIAGAKADPMIDRAIAEIPAKLS